ncbi:hypothetical protein SmJEL517_g01650 [Synchytrium microbalum]|uniref:Thiolase-like protein type 1 additional C-terminal domain-containing protein n=1 Tax=Synchytrium microbalum TaxID=1806994 RepID=A0A507C9Y7_9FUNG|nr:uncharacterized protein SmJEL517_g01650 [Synchytrium microbalum]TPX36158.1 hypothetical protein SmJEL517_g01650 [Synchytrium microbalum]
MSAKIPIIVGAADYKNRSKDVVDALEPAELMARAIDAALDDAGSSKIRQSVDSIDCVINWGWPYSDLPGQLAKRLGLNPLKHKDLSGMNGAEPNRLLDEAARRIAYGETTVEVVTGGEALASLEAFQKAKKFPPPWTPSDNTPTETFKVSNRPRAKDLLQRHGFMVPSQGYCLYENAYRAHRNQSIQANHDESVELYADFAQIAKKHPAAWNYGTAETKQTIGTFSGKNRMIQFPYPLLMNAFNSVNLAGAVVLTSTEAAKAMGIPESKWVYIYGAAGTQDSGNILLRPNYIESPALTRALQTTMKVAGVTPSDLDAVDIYSCFPIVPKLACAQLGLPVLNGPKPVTLLGGLTSFGGAGNSYSMHALVAMSKSIREGKYRKGLVLANGGWLTYEWAVVLAKTPRTDGVPYTTKAALPKEVTDVPIPPIAEVANGACVVESYTVQYSRDNKPELAIIVGRLNATGERFIANEANEQTLKEFVSSREPVGRAGIVTSRNDTQINMFSFGSSSL